MPVIQNHSEIFIGDALDCHQAKNNSIHTLKWRTNPLYTLSKNVKSPWHTFMYITIYILKFVHCLSSFQKHVFIQNSTQWP